MKATEIQEKLDKANEAVAKRIATLTKQEAKAAKYLSQIQSRGWDENNPHCRYGTEDHEECYWLICDYDRAIDDIKGSNQKLKELRTISNNWSEKLAKQNALETTIATKMPAVFKTLRDQLAEEWTEYDLKAAEQMRADYRTMEYTKFNKKWSYSRKEELERPLEAIKASNEREAEIFIVDLHNRVLAVTGEVTDWNNIRFSGKALNGMVIGTKGSAIVETITAGGYNIQRLHYRVLVKPTDESKR